MKTRLDALVAVLALALALFALFNNFRTRARLDRAKARVDEMARADSARYAQWEYGFGVNDTLHADTLAVDSFRVWRKP